MAKQLTFSCAGIKYKKRDRVIDRNGLAFPITNIEEAGGKDIWEVIEVNEAARKVIVRLAEEFDENIRDVWQEVSATHEIETDPGHEITKITPAQLNEIRGIDNFVAVIETDEDIIVGSRVSITRIRQQVGIVDAVIDPKGMLIITEIFVYMEIPMKGYWAQIRWFEGIEDATPALDSDTDDFETCEDDPELLAEEFDFEEA